LASGNNGNCLYNACLFQVGTTLRGSMPALDAQICRSIETNFNPTATSSVYVSTPGAHQAASWRSRRPASMQLTDQYDEIPADRTTPLAAAGRRATCDDIRFKPQPPRPDLGQDVGQGHGRGQRSSEIRAECDVVDCMRRKSSYDDNDVILIDSVIYG